MKTFTEKQRMILEMLADGQWHSGEALGKYLKISRTAVWKQINHLIALGIAIHSVTHRGYQLASPLVLLNEEVIRSELVKQGFEKPCHFHLFASLDSTNRFLKDLPSSPQLLICCTETQTGGRGRFGRVWYSPFGKNIYCSLRYSVAGDISALSGLSLVVSLAVLKTLKAFTAAPLWLKWPNDLLWEEKKISGNLIEVTAESNNQAEVTIGIGININSQMEEVILDKPLCSLWDITQCYFDRNHIIARLIIELDSVLSQFLRHGFKNFMTDWNQSDYLKGKWITVSSLRNQLTGVAMGVNAQGQLLLKDAQDEWHILAAGETSLKG